MKECEADKNVDDDDDEMTSKQEYSIADQFIYPSQIQDVRRIEVDSWSYLYSDGHCTSPALEENER